MIFRRFGTEGLGLTPDEWEDAVVPGYDPKNLSSYEPLSTKGQPASKGDPSVNP
jgi:hypothetical protein